MAARSSPGHDDHVSGFPKINGLKRGADDLIDYPICGQADAIRLYIQQLPHGHLPGKHGN